MKTFRDYALSILEHYFKNPGKLSEIITIQASKSNISSQTRSEIYELVLGTFRVYELLEEIVNSRLEKDPPTKIKQILILAVYELLEMDGIPDYATVNSWVEIAKQDNPKLSGLVNAVLKYIIRNREEITTHFDERKRNNFPEWIQRRMDETQNEYANFSNYLSSRPVTDAIVFENLTDALEFTNDSDLELPNHRIITNITGLLQSDDFKNGKISVMDRASQLAVRYGFDTDSTSLIDLCSAPGNKLMYWLKNNPNLETVISIDKHDKKIKQVIQSAERLGVRQKLMTGVGDATKVKFDKVDVVLVDAPCSGSGVINRKPDIRMNQNGDNLKQLQKLQIELLENAARLVKIGGKIVYSTCSFLKMENEIVIERFLRNNTNFHYELSSDPVMKPYLTNTGMRTFPNTHTLDGACAFILRKIS